MMSTAEMLQKIQTALATDAEFIGWCYLQLGATPTIQIDFDEEQELEADCYPFVGILAVKDAGDIRQLESTYRVRMVAAVRRADLTNTPVSVTLNDSPVEVTVKTRTYPGRLQAESLREQAMRAMYRAKLGKVSIGSDDMSHTYHPKFYSPFTVTIEERN